MILTIPNEALQPSYVFRTSFPPADPETAVFLLKPPPSKNTTQMHSNAVTIRTGTTTENRENTAPRPFPALFSRLSLFNLILTPACRKLLLPLKTAPSGKYICPQKKRLSQKKSPSSKRNATQFQKNPSKDGFFERLVRAHQSERTQSVRFRPENSSRPQIHARSNYSAAFRL